MTNSASSSRASYFAPPSTSKAEFSELAIHSRPPIGLLRVHFSPHEWLRNVDHPRHLLALAVPGLRCVINKSWEGSRSAVGVGLATRPSINSVAGGMSRWQPGLVESEAEAVPTSSDGRWLALAELGQQEREMTQALWAVRSQIAHLVEDALPPHVRSAQVEEAVTASGYSRTLIDALRRGQHEWNRWPRT